MLKHDFMRAGRINLLITLEMGGGKGGGSQKESLFENLLNIEKIISERSTLSVPGRPLPPKT